MQLIHDNFDDYMKLKNERNNDLSNNLTYVEHAPKLTNSTYTKIIVLTTIAILSLVVNFATIYSLIKHREKKKTCSTIYTLILHLCIADVLVTIFCIGGEALWSYTVAWLWGNVTCKAFKFFQMFSLYLSTFILVLIGIERFLVVKYPMKSFTKSQRCNRYIVTTWILALICSTPQIIIFRVVRGPFIEDFSQCVTHGFYSEPWQEQLYTTLSLILMFLLPLLILAITYICTVITIARSGNLFKTELTNSLFNRIVYDDNRRRLINRAKAKSLRISMVIVAAFVLWWTPYYTMMIIFMFLRPNKHFSEKMQNSIFFFGMSNSLINPIIYGLFHVWPKKRYRRERCSYSRTPIYWRHSRELSVNRQNVLCD